MLFLVLILCFHFLQKEVKSYSCEGCSTDTSCVEMQKNRVYGCHGTFTSGVTSGESICSYGYEICINASVVLELLNDDPSLGYSSVTSPIEFYATRQSSQNNYQCAPNGTNDVWGIASPLSTLYVAASCDGVLNEVIGGPTAYCINNAWCTYSGDDELNDISLSNSSYGGVLCCTTENVTSNFVSTSIFPSTTVVQTWYDPCSLLSICNESYYDNYLGSLGNEIATLFGISESDTASQNALNDFIQFAYNYSKNYSLNDSTSLMYYYNSFSSNNVLLQELDAMYPSVFGINDWFDIAYKDMVANFTGALMPDDISNITATRRRSLLNDNYHSNHRSLLNYPSSHDWSNTSYKTIVKLQTQGDCYAYATTTMFEYNYKIATEVTDTNFAFSAKQAAYCATDRGCDGGWGDRVTEAIFNRGAICMQHDDDDWHFECNPDRYGYYCNNFTNCELPSLPLPNKLEHLTSDEEVRSWVYNYGVMTACVNATPAFYAIKNDTVVTKKMCDATGNPDHLITIVGYGYDTKSGEDYWVIQNSWGTSWGHHGFARLAVDACFIDICNKSGVRYDTDLSSYLDQTVALTSYKYGKQESANNQQYLVYDRNYISTINSTIIKSKALWNIVNDSNNQYQYLYNYFSGSTWPTGCYLNYNGSFECSTSYPKDKLSIRWNTTVSNYLTSIFYYNKYNSYLDVYENSFITPTANYIPIKMLPFMSTIKTYVNKTFVLRNRYYYETQWKNYYLQPGTSSSDDTYVYSLNLSSELNNKTYFSTYTYNPSIFFLYSRYYKKYFQIINNIGETMRFSFTTNWDGSWSIENPDLNIYIGVNPSTNDIVYSSTIGKTERWDIIMITSASIGNVNVNQESASAFFYAPTNATVHTTTYTTTKNTNLGSSSLRIQFNMFVSYCVVMFSVLFYVQSF